MGGSSLGSARVCPCIQLALGRHGAQIKSLQEGPVQVPLEVEEEAHPPSAEEAPQDAPTLQVVGLCGEGQRSYLDTCAARTSSEGWAGMLCMIGCRLPQSDAYKGALDAEVK